MSVVCDGCETEVAQSSIFVDWLTNLDKYVTFRSRRKRRQELGLSVLVLETVRCTSRDVNQITGRYLKCLVTYLKREVAFEDKELFFGISV